VQVRVEDDDLLISVPEQWETALYREASYVFLNLRRDVPDLKFSRDDAGAVTGFTEGIVTAKRVK
jgi:hypothetical protein